MTILQYILVVFGLAVVTLLYLRVFLPFMEYRRLKAQGVVFNNRGWPMIDDVIAL
jgi:hypothetical protein